MVIEATGGNSIFSLSGYTYHVFTTGGTFTPLFNGLQVEYLIVAGGGAGAYARNGGGGAGGLLHNFTGSPITLTTTGYPIVVGAGGQGAGFATGGNNGQNSTAFGLTAIGGGGGRAGASNGSGGSGGGNNYANTATSVAGTSGQGKSGGAGSNPSLSLTNRQGGGGGGAGAAGGNAASNQGGNGGAGLDMSPYVGTSVGASGWFAGGGGGGSQSGTGGAGGQGGGAAGTNSTIGLSGQANTGGGGGSTSSNSGGVPYNTGGTGGAGIVIIRYVPTIPSLTVTLSGYIIGENTVLNWNISNEEYYSCSANTTVNIYRSYDGENFTIIQSGYTGGTSYTDTPLVECVKCFKVYYKVVTNCELINSNVLSLVLGFDRVKWNLGGINRLWIANKPSNLDYTVMDATFKTIEYDGNNINTISGFTQTLTWYELPVSETVNYKQKMSISAQGYVFSEVLEVEIPKLNPAKWQGISDLLGDHLIVVFLTNNGEYCVMGYDSPAQIDVYEATTEDSKYNFSIEVKHNYNLLKFIDVNYVLNNIL